MFAKEAGGGSGICLSLLLSSLFCFFFFFGTYCVFCLGVASVEATPAHQELQDESGEGLERLGPHTDANIMKNVTVLSFDSAASPHLQSKTTEQPHSASAGSTHAPSDSVDLRVESPGSSPFEEVSGNLNAADENEANSDGFYQSLSVETAQAPSVYVPKWTATNGFKMDDPWVFQSLVDNFPTPGYVFVLRNMGAKELLDHYNLLSSQQFSAGG